VAPLARLVRRGGDYVALTKPGIVLFLLLTALTGAMVAARGSPRPGAVVLTLLGLALTAGGANAVNMWYDRDIDPIMERTKRRPLPAGRLTPTEALTFGLVSGLAGTALLAAFVNREAALLAASGYLFYVLVYTFWLKRRTPQNIVIGGAAGAFPPLVGWAGVTGHVSLAAWIMFLIIFLWTPPHFWALALYKEGEYRRAGIPMMPVVRGDVATVRQSLVYSVALLLASLLLYATGAVGLPYLVTALVLGLGFVAIHVRLLTGGAPRGRTARQAFRLSLLYVLGLFAAMMVGLPHP
jgi:protoheme IX farnesyltransferase